MRRFWESMNEEVAGVVFWPVAIGVIAIGTSAALLHL